MAPGKRLTRSVSLCIEKLKDQRPLRSRKNMSIAQSSAQNVKCDKIILNDNLPPPKRQKISNSLSIKKVKNQLEQLNDDTTRDKSHLVQVTSIADNLNKANTFLNNEVKDLKDIVLKKDSDIIRAYERLCTVQLECQLLVESVKKKDEQIEALEAAVRSYKVDTFGNDLMEFEEGKSIKYFRYKIQTFPA